MAGEALRNSEYTKYQLESPLKRTTDIKKVGVVPAGERRVEFWA